LKTPIELLRLEYAYIGLPALEGLPYYNGANLLGLALSALMKLPAADSARIKAEGLARIARAKENTARIELLAECFNNYLELDPSEKPEFDRMLAEQTPEVKNMVSSFEISGRIKEKRDIVRKQLEAKFHPLPPDVAQRIATLPVERLDEIIMAVLTAQSLKELGMTDE
jgi:hypothetical protein